MTASSATATAPAASAPAAVASMHCYLAVRKLAAAAPGAAPLEEVHADLRRGLVAAAAVTCGSRSRNPPHVPGGPRPVPVRGLARAPLAAAPPPPQPSFSSSSAAAATAAAARGSSSFWSGRGCASVVVCVGHPLDLFCNGCASVRVLVEQQQQQTKNRLHVNFSISKNSMAFLRANCAFAPVAC